MKALPSTIPLIALAAVLYLYASSDLEAQRPSAPIVDTGQNQCFNTLEPIRSPKEGRAFFGQDAQYAGLQASYQDNGDGTVTDLNTGLTWSQATDAQKVTLKEAQAIAQSMTLGGHDDWRVPSVKELYSLMDFRGVTGIAGRDMSSIPATAVPYINTDVFEFRYGKTKDGERFIDAQWLTDTINVSPIFGRQEGLFGVNFADGRIKCYPLENRRMRSEKTFYARYVRGRGDYGHNDYVDNGDGTITDRSTGLTWMQADCGAGMNWQDALAYAADLEHGGHSDWRIPNAKELQSIVDYNRSPDATNSAAIDPIFQTSEIQNEANQTDYPYFWSSTTHLDGPNARQAVYFAFGRGIGQMHEQVLDVHGAGCQRSDPKDGEPALGHGPQGDAQRIFNYVRCVRGGALLVDPKQTYEQPKQSEYPYRIQLADSTYNAKPMKYEKAPTTHMQGGQHPPHGGHPSGMQPPHRR